MALQKARVLLCELLRPPPQSTDVLPVAFKVDLVMFCERFALSLPLPHKISEVRQQGAVIESLVGIPNARTHMEPGGQTCEVVEDNMIWEDGRAVAIELTVMTRDREPRIHPPRTVSYCASHLAALRDLCWDTDGFESMELSALPWMALVGEGRRDHGTPESCGTRLCETGRACLLIVFD